MPALTFMAASVDPTVEVGVRLNGGALGLAMVPSGAQQGRNEALGLRGVDHHARGKGVPRACGGGE